MAGGHVSRAQESREPVEARCLFRGGEAGILRPDAEPEVGIIAAAQSARTAASRVSVQRELHVGHLEKEQHGDGSISSVSYTHLTLPTN